MLNNLKQSDEHRVGSVLGAGVVELPAVIVFVVIDVRDILFLFQDVSRRKGRRILGLIERPI